ncbi:MAG TPA: PKD domain-containing protein, partial [Humisphaera sp.]|nr:PKD domain-containing protein [Humisphaera sp.]
MKHQAQTSGRNKFQSSNNSLTASVARRGAAGSDVSPAAKLRAARNKKPRASNANALANAALEALEGRELMSATIGVANGILTLQADPQTASRMIVRLSHEGQQVTATINGQDQSFDLKNLKGVQMTGSSKADVMRVDQRITLPTTLNGGAGNDRIYGGGGADHIDAGDGKDYVNGHAGNDNINGGNGNDTLVGDAGKDYLDGGAGNDSIYGRTGNDSIVGDVGIDTLWGGMGNDTLDGSAGADVINGQAGRNRILQGAKDRVHLRRGDVVVNTSNTNSTPPSVQTPQTPKTGGSNNGGSTNNPTTDPPPVIINNGGGNQNNGGSSQNSGQDNGNTNTSVTGQTADGTLANIQFIEATGMAGHSVHVNALGSTLGTGDALNAEYSWDFGDPGSRFNTLVGWTAGHIYDTPGTYTVTLTVSDSAGQTSTTTGTVTITADTRKVIYVDANGSDANTGASPSAAVKTVDRANELLTENSTILFHSGQSFDVSDTLSINHSNVTVGAYGSGKAPTLRKVTGTGSSIIMVQPGANDVLIEGIVFDSMWTIEKFGDGRVPARGIFDAGNNFAVRNCQFYNVDDAISTARTTGVIVQDNYFG